jgi:hypothetical protein
MSAYEIRIPANLFHQIHLDLDRPHEFAFERVGFMYCAFASSEGLCTLLGETYAPVGDDQYLRSNEYGALVGRDGIRQALERAYATKACVVHIHRHEHKGRPEFSFQDVATNMQLVPTFWNVAPGVPHAAMVLSHDRARSDVWDPKSREIKAARSIKSVGFRLEELS